MELSGIFQESFQHHGPFWDRQSTAPVLIVAKVPPPGARIANSCCFLLGVFFTGPPNSWFSLQTNHMGVPSKQDTRGFTCGQHPHLHVVLPCFTWIFSCSPNKKPSCLEETPCKASPSVASMKKNREAWGAVCSPPSFPSNEAPISSFPEARETTLKRRSFFECGVALGGGVHVFDHKSQSNKSN